MIDMKVYFVLLKNEKGQSILEYALLLIFIVGVALFYIGVVIKNEKDL